MSRRKNTQKPTKRQASQQEFSGGSEYWDLAGLEFTAPRLAWKAGRKSTKKTVEFLNKSADLLAQNKPDWPLALLYYEGPRYQHLSDKQKRARFRILKSKNRKLHDHLIKEYKKKYVHR